MTHKNLLITFIAAITLILTACGTSDESSEESEEMNSDKEEISHSDMDYSSSGKVPEDLEEAENPTY